MIIAAQNGYIEVAKLLIEANANVNALALNGNISALGAAAYNGYQNIVELLLSNKADPGLKLNNGITAYGLALEAGKQNIAALLKNPENHETQDYPIDLNAIKEIPLTGENHNLDEL